MKLRILCAASLIVFGLNAMEVGTFEVSKKAESLLDALKIGGGLVVYRSNDPISVPAVKEAIGDLRNNDGSKKAIDFIVTDTYMYEGEGGGDWTTNPLALTSIVNYQFYGTRFSRGTVVCRIASDDTKSGKQLIQDINCLRTTWPVVVHIDNAKMNLELKEFFSKKGATVLGEEPKNNSYLGRILIFGSAVAFLAFLYYKFGVGKS